MDDKRKGPAELDDAALEDASGGLPAVQKVREAARLTSSTSAADGSVKTSITDGTSNITDGTSNTILYAEKPL